MTIRTVFKRMCFYLNGDFQLNVEKDIFRETTIPFLIGYRRESMVFEIRSELVHAH